MTPLRKLYKFLASLKLAVILLVLLAAVLGMATYMESIRDAKTASHLIYGSTWFSLLLLMLGVNVACAAAIRYPWKRSQTGFVIVHLGIIVILIGSLVTRYMGIEGMMTLAEGQQSDTITLDHPMLQYQTLTPTAPNSPIHSIPVELRWNNFTDEAPPVIGRVFEMMGLFTYRPEIRIPLDNGMTAVIDRYIHNARQHDFYREQTGDKTSDTPAIHIQLTAGKGAPMAEGTIMADEWLAPDEPERREIKMGPATLRVTRARTKQELDAALATAPAEALDASDGVVAVSGQAFAVHGNEGKALAVKGTPYRIRIDRFLPFAIVQDNKLISKSDEKENPAVELTVLDDKGEAERQILFAKHPEFSTAHHQARPTNLKFAYAMDDPRKKGNEIDFVIGPDGQVRALVSAAGGTPRVDDVKVGEQRSTGWRMNFNYAVLDSIAKAEPAREFTEVKKKPGMMGGGGGAPALRIRVEGADKPGPFWLQEGDTVSVSRAASNELVRLRYGLESYPVGFDVKLTKFEVGYDPGTRNPATYTSWVNVYDQKNNRQFETVITMNEPMVYHDLTFFQASFSQGEGGAQSSTFQVARDPGVPVKYGGSLILCAGLAIYAFSRQPRNRSQEADSKGAIKKTKKNAGMPAKV